MRPIDLLELLWQQPFRPFRLLLSSGASYEVRHPELPLVGASTLILDVQNAQYPFLGEKRRVLIALSHIVQIEVLPPPVSPTTN